MEKLEIILKDIRKNYISPFFLDYINLGKENIISSHFFDTKRNMDITYQNVGDINKYFNVPGTCNIYLKEVSIGKKIQEVLTIISCDEIYGDITISFDEKQLNDDSEINMEINARAVLNELIWILSKWEIKKIYFGYEPAEDEDMKIVEIGESGKILPGKRVLKASREDMTSKIWGKILEIDNME